MVKLTNRKKREKERDVFNNIEIDLCILFLDKIQKIIILNIILIKYCSLTMPVKKEDIVDAIRTYFIQVNIIK